MRILTADPGKKHVGWALFDVIARTGCLVTCGLIRFEGFEKADVYPDTGEAICPDVVIIERPLVYPQRRQKGDPNDLIDIALTAGSVGANMRSVCNFADVLTVTPRDWKGTVPKDINLKRIKDRMLKSLNGGQDWNVFAGVLNESETPKSLQHNVLDAIGMGYWACDQGEERWQTRS